MEGWCFFALVFLSGADVATLTRSSIKPAASWSLALTKWEYTDKVVAGFAAFTNHLSYLPHSGSVLSELADDLAGYMSTPGSLHFPNDQPLPRALVEKLIDVRLRQVRQPGAPPSASASPAT